MPEVNRAGERATGRRVIAGIKTVDVLVDTTIARTPAVVSTFAADPTHASEWYTNIRSVTWKTPPPAAIGSRMEFEATFLGRRLAYTYAIVELVAGQRLIMRTADGPFPMETTYTWEASEAGTRMTLRNRGEPSGFARVAAPVIDRRVRFVEEPIDPRRNPSPSNNRWDQEVRHRVEHEGNTLGGPGVEGGHVALWIKGGST